MTNDEALRRPRRPVPPCEPRNFRLSCDRAFGPKRVPALTGATPPRNETTGGGRGPLPRGGSFRESDFGDQDGWRMTTEKWKHGRSQDTGAWARSSLGLLLLVALASVSSLAALAAPA